MEVYLLAAEARRCACPKLTILANYVPGASCFCSSCLFAAVFRGLQEGRCFRFLCVLEVLISEAVFLVGEVRTG